MFQNQISNLSNFQGIQLESDISVITLDDNISHTYFSKIKWEQDNYLPIGIAKIIMPYSSEVARYWVRYSGAVIIHANLNSNEQNVTNAMLHSLPSTTSLNMKKAQEAKEKAEELNKKNGINTDKKKVETKKDKHKKKISIKNDFYNYSFIGKVSRFKQIGKTFVVYLEDLGWKFLQKVPKEFRDTYIAGQTLDNAFQAICEFIGVEFAYSIEDLSGYTFSTDGYSIQKDGEIIEDVPSILKEWGKSEEEEEEDDKEKNPDEAMASALNSSTTPELGGLADYQSSNQSNNQSSNSSSNQALNSAITNASNQANTDPNQQQQQQEQQNNPIEKIEQYQEEFDEKIKDLFIGNTFYDSNISDPILNYDWITVTPQVAATSTTTPTNTTQNPNDPNAQNQNSTTNNNGTNTNNNQNQQNTTQS